MCWSKGRERRPLTQCRSHPLCRCPWRGLRHLLHSRTPLDQTGGHSMLEHSVCRSWLVPSSHLLYSHVHHDWFWALTCYTCVSWLVLSSHLLYVYHDWFWALTCYKCVSWLILSSHLLYMCIMTGSQLSLPIHAYISNKLPSLWQTAQILYPPLHCIRRVHNWQKNFILSKLSSPRCIIDNCPTVPVGTMITPCAWWATSFLQAS